jgi:hypothetical protein
VLRGSRYFFPQFFRVRHAEVDDDVEADRLFRLFAVKAVDGQDVVYPPDGGDDRLADERGPVVGYV